MGVLAMQTLLVSIDHGLPIEVAVVLQAPSMRQAGEINPLEKMKDVREVLFEGRSGVRYGTEEEAGLSQIASCWLSVCIRHDGRLRIVLVLGDVQLHASELVFDHDFFVILETRDWAQQIP